METREGCVLCLFFLLVTPRMNSAHEQWHALTTFKLPLLEEARSLQERSRTSCSSVTSWLNFERTFVANFGPPRPQNSATNHLATHHTYHHSNFDPSPALLVQKFPLYSVITINLEVESFSLGSTPPQGFPGQDEMAKQFVAVMVLLCVCMALSVQVNAQVPAVPAPAPYMRGWEPVPSPETYAPTWAPAYTPAYAPGPYVDAPAYAPGPYVETPAYAPGPLSGLWVTINIRFRRAHCMFLPVVSMQLWRAINMAFTEAAPLSI